MVRKRSEMVRKLPGNGLEMVRKWSVNGQEIVRTWSLNGQEMALLLDLSRQLHSCLFHEHIEGSFPRIIITSSCVSRTITHSLHSKPSPLSSLGKDVWPIETFSRIHLFCRAHPLNLLSEIEHKRVLCRFLLFWKLDSHRKISTREKG